MAANAWYPIARERVVPYAASVWYIIAREMTIHIIARRGRQLEAVLGTGPGHPLPDARPAHRGVADRRTAKIRCSFDFTALGGWACGACQRRNSNI